MNYISRSAIQEYRHCPRKRFLGYHYHGRGIRPKEASIPLTTGTCTHNGVGFILGQMKNGKPVNAEVIDEAVRVGLIEYEKVVVKGLRGKGTDGKYKQEFNFKEQCALTEAIIRLWAIYEYPVLNEHYQVLEVEREEAIELVPGLTLESRVDAILKKKNTKSLFNYQLKTSKMWNSRNMNSYRTDLQGILEWYNVEQRLIREQAAIQNIVNLSKDVQSIDKDNQAILEKFYSKYLDNSLVGIKWCILVKGDRKAVSEGGIYETNHPMIKGWKKVFPNDIKFAHSYYFENRDNKSGRGGLGSTWDSFYVWDNDFGWTVKKWVQACVNGEIQENAKGELAQWVVSPPEDYRKRIHIEDTVKQVVIQEKNINVALNNLKVVTIDPQYKDTTNGELVRQDIMNSVFDQHQNGCYFPDVCEYLDICWNGETDPIGSGKFEYRIPHHQRELEQHNKLYQIEGDINV